MMMTVGEGGEVGLGDKEEEGEGEGSEVIVGALETMDLVNSHSYSPCRR